MDYMVHGILQATIVKLFISCLHKVFCICRYTTPSYCKKTFKVWSFLHTFLVYLCVIHIYIHIAEDECI